MTPIAGAADDERNLERRCARRGGARDSWSTSGSSSTESTRSLRRRSRTRSSSSAVGELEADEVSASSPDAASMRAAAPCGRAIVTVRASSSSRSRSATSSSSRCRSISVTRAFDHLVQRLELAPTSGSPTRRGARSRSRRPPGQPSSDDRFLVLVGEVGAALLLGQVEVAVGDAAEHDRHAEERAHRRMAGREPDRARVRREVVQAQRRRVADQHAEDAAAAPAGRRSRRASRRRCRT